MVPRTRRTFLHGAAGLAAALAGCSGLLGGSGGSTRTAPRDENGGGPASGSRTDPETFLVRVDTDRQPVWLADSGRGGGRPTARDREPQHESEVVDGSRVDRVRVADGADREGVESFLAATDFETETVYIDAFQVEECFQLDLCHVSWTPNEISTDYTRRSRSYTERCAVDEWVFEARLIRLPDAIDADSVNSYSSGVGTGSCDNPRARAEGDRGSGSSSASEDSETATGAGGDGQ